MWWFLFSVRHVSRTQFKVVSVEFPVYMNVFSFRSQIKKGDSRVLSASFSECCRPGRLLECVWPLSAHCMRYCPHAYSYAPKPLSIHCCLKKDNNGIS